MAYSRIRFEIQNSATMTLVHDQSAISLHSPIIRDCQSSPKLISDFRRGNGSEFLGMEAI